MAVEDYLNSKGIKFEVYEHQAVMTCEEAETHCAHVPGMQMKNIMLNNSKKSRFFLVLLPAKKRLEIKRVEEVTGEKHLSFSSPETLLKKLGLTPGAVSPFGLINNQEKDVELIIDGEVTNAQKVSFHPNRNTASLAMGYSDFEKYLTGLGINPTIIR